MKEYERNIGYGEGWLKTILEVQFAFLIRVEKVKLYMAMMSLEKILITHKDRYGHSDIQATDMIMWLTPTLHRRESMCRELEGLRERTG